MKRAFQFLLVILCCKASFSQAPVWSVTPADYEYTATMTTILKINDTLINSSGNILGAFVGSQERGVATPTNVGGTNMYFITLYSNIASGENITFKAYIASEDSIHNSVDSVVFTSNASFGDPVTPHELHLNNSLTPHFTSFNSYSTNVSGNFNQVDLSQFTVNNGGDSITYLVTNSSNINGAILNDTLFPTHIGNVGMDSLLLTIVDSSNTSIIFDQQYMYFEVTGVNNPISFNQAGPFLWGNNSNPCVDLSSYLSNIDADTIQWFVGANELDSSGSDTVNWNVNPADFQYDMSLVAECKVNGMAINNGNYQLAAFQDSILVGVSSPIFTTGRWLNFMTIYSDTTSASITFQLFDIQDSIILDERVSSMAFTANDIVGDLNSPAALEFGNFTFTLSDSTLCIDLFDSIPGLIDSLTIVATEVGTSDLFSDTMTVTFNYFDENQPLINGIPDQEIMIGDTFVSIDLGLYLTELDGDSVLYTIIDTTNLSVSVDTNHVVSVFPNSPTWTGSDTIRFIVADSNINMLSDYQDVIFTIVPAIEVIGIPDQTINSGGSFFTTDLELYLNYNQPDSIEWTITNTDLIPVLNGHLVDLYFPSASWTGSDTIYFLARNIHDSTIFDSDTAVFTVLEPTDVYESVLVQSTIFPNPAINQFTLSTNKSLIGSTAMLVDISGRSIYTANIKSNRTEFKIQSLSSGVYYVWIWNKGDRIETIPVMIK